MTLAKKIRLIAAGAAILGTGTLAATQANAAPLIASPMTIADQHDGQDGDHNWNFNDRGFDDRSFDGGQDHDRSQEFRRNDEFRHDAPVQRDRGDQRWFHRDSRDDSRFQESDQNRNDHEGIWRR